MCLREFEGFKQVSEEESVAKTWFVKTLFWKFSNKFIEEYMQRRSFEVIIALLRWSCPYQSWNNRNYAEAPAEEYKKLK